LFINSQMAYDDLEPKIKALLSDKFAIFDYSIGIMERCLSKGFEYPIALEDRRDNVCHPVFCKHKKTNKYSIFVKLDALQ
jgi:hypothetical protein